MLSPVYGQVYVGQASQEALNRFTARFSSAFRPSVSSPIPSRRSGKLGESSRDKFSTAKLLRLCVWLLLLLNAPFPPLVSSLLFPLFRFLFPGHPNAPLFPLDCLYEAVSLPVDDRESNSYGGGNEDTSAKIPKRQRRTEQKGEGKNVNSNTTDVVAADLHVSEYRRAYGLFVFFSTLEQQLRTVRRGKDEGFEANIRQIELFANFTKVKVAPTTCSSRV